MNYTYEIKCRAPLVQRACVVFLLRVNALWKCFTHRRPKRSLIETNLCAKVFTEIRKLSSYLVCLPYIEAWIHEDV